MRPQRSELNFLLGHAVGLAEKALEKETEEEVKKRNMSLTLLNSKTEMMVTLGKKGIVQDQPVVLTIK